MEGRGGGGGSFSGERGGVNDFCEGVERSGGDGMEVEEWVLVEKEEDEGMIFGWGLKKR